MGCLPFYSRWVGCRWGVIFWICGLLVLVHGTLGCSPTAEDTFDLEDLNEIETQSAALSVVSSITQSCSTGVVDTLSQQLIDELNCLRPDVLERFDGNPKIQISDVVFPYLQKPAALALEKALSLKTGSMQITSALRTLPQQYLLYEWGKRGKCNISVAASPGQSDHNAGLALDVSNYSTWKSALTQAGFEWYGAGDEVHFSYHGAGTEDIHQDSIKAFQRLWNRNHPEDSITVNGEYDSATKTRLEKSPSEGFAQGADCSEIEDNVALKFNVIDLSFPPALKTQETAQVVVELQNSGTAEWPPSTELVALKPPLQESLFAAASWADKHTVKTIDKTVRPGESLRMVFEIQGPNLTQPTTQIEYFALLPPNNPPLSVSTVEKNRNQSFYIQIWVNNTGEGTGSSSDFHREDEFTLQGGCSLGYRGASNASALAFTLLMFLIFATALARRRRS